MDLLVSLGLEGKKRGQLPRARAFLRAAHEVARRLDFDDLLARGRLRDIRGVGRGIAATIQRFADAGEAPSWLPHARPSEHAAEAAAGFPLPADFAAAPFREAPDLHCHTLWSDGTLSVDEVVAYARRLGAKAVGISDHSGSLRIARGLDAQAVRAQWEDIARVQAAHTGFRLLRGTECDIREDGSLDHPPEVLDGFDYVIGSLHTALRLPAKEQTERVLAALEDPRLIVLGHPTTRVPGRRPGANLDLPRVFEAAARHDVALEVNGNPGRLDLDAALAREALLAGARLSLGSDAHRAEEMPCLAVARRIAAEAGARPEHIVNLDYLAAAKPV